MTDVVVVESETIVTVVDEVVHVVSVGPLDDEVQVITLGEQGPEGAEGFGLLGVATVAEDPAIEIDISERVGVYQVTLEGNRAITFTGGTPQLDRRRFILEVTQGAPGGWILIPDATVKFGADLPAIELSEGAGAVDALGFIYHHASGQVRFVAISHGF